MQDTKAGKFRIGNERFLTGRAEGFSDVKLVADRKTTHKADRRASGRRSTDKPSPQQKKRLI